MCELYWKPQGRKGQCTLANKKPVTFQDFLDQVLVSKDRDDGEIYIHELDNGRGEEIYQILTYGGGSITWKSDDMVNRIGSYNVVEAWFRPDVRNDGKTYKIYHVAVRA